MINNPWEGYSANQGSYNFTLCKKQILEISKDFEDT